MTEPTKPTGLPRTPTFSEMADRSWEKLMAWIDGRESHVNLGFELPYTPDVIALMNAQETIKWLAVYETFQRLAMEYAGVELAGNEEE